MIYFIGNKEEKKVKIGYSSDQYVRQRFHTIQSNCPFQVELFLHVNGMKRIEKHIHKLFNKYKIRGEWFELSNEIEEFIKNPVLPFIEETFKPVLTLKGQNHPDIEKLYAEGKSIQKIADTLGFSFSQIRTHITRRKLSAKYPSRRKVGDHLRTPRILDITEPKELVFV